MRVRFSYDIFRVQARGGVSRYVAELHQGLLARSVDSRILAVLHRNAHLDGVPAVWGLDVDWVRPTLGRQALSKIVDRAFERAWAPGQSPATIYHKTYFDLRVPTGPTLAVTVYDMIHELYPAKVGPRDVTPASKRPWCEAADIVFAISETTRDDVVERFRLDPDRVVVTPLGVRAVAPAPDAVPAGAPPFVLYVGDRGHEHKNFESFVRAFARTAHHRELRLVCFGGGPFRPDELVLLRELGLADAEARGGSDAALAAHYRAARAFVYPSLYEGFGLPPLEAMINGCPVAAARAGSVPEVVGEAALLFDPEDEDAITAAIDRIVSDDALRTELIAAGHARALAYSWDNTVDLTLAAYERIGRRC